MTPRPPPPPLTPQEEQAIRDYAARRIATIGGGLWNREGIERLLATLDAERDELPSRRCLCHDIAHDYAAR